MKNLNTVKRLFQCIYIAIPYLISFSTQSQTIPLSEHPRPDFERPEWTNLNGQWSFEFDQNDEGVAQEWWLGEKSFSKEITVPFPWGSKLSGLTDDADIGWYKRDISVSSDWRGKRTFLIIGASDWETTVWLDGQRIGTHQGGYVPIELELTDYLKYDQKQSLVVRVDDIRREFTLYGKQGYGNARGIWQTTYLEARGNDYLDAVHFTPNIDSSQVAVTAYLPSNASSGLQVDLRITTETGILEKQLTIPKGNHKGSMVIDIPEQHLWSLDDPFLYDVNVSMGDDEFNTYFGMRKISTINLPGTDYPYIALNNEPIYVQLALDQSYHPDGYYTFPSDQFMKEEIERSKSIGLNGIRIHIKLEVPRKLYWADKLGLLVMEDLPNSWGEPDAKMQAESEYTLRQMIKRDYNHPSIFSWVVFNETWGLRTKVAENDHKYLPETQNWVASMYYLTKSLDMTRLVEDNSICCGAGHTETDINSWHIYLPGYKWEEYLKDLTENTYPGSTHHFEKGFTQGSQPNINSECGNVWGYEGSTGDVDWSWDYHRMMNTYRKYPKVAGWLYTEHHDVINEWNGYWRFDRTEKETGMGDLVPGMTLNDLHADVYLSTGMDISLSVEGGEQIEIPLYLSAMTGKNYGSKLNVSYKLTTTDYIGRKRETGSGSFDVVYKPWLQKVLTPLKLTVPNVNGVSLLSFEVSTTGGVVLSRNFMHLTSTTDIKPDKIEVISIPAAGFSNANWSRKQWNVMNGKKVNGTGKGIFEYTFELPANFKENGIKDSYFLVEVSAKELFVKDQESYNQDQDFMLGSLVANSSNPNSYPMTDETFFPSKVSISVNGVQVMTTTLADDPADHRGVLSWHNQLEDGKLREAGSYGYLVKAPIKKKILQNALNNDRKVVISLQTLGEGGIAVYGKDFGRYPLDPSLVIMR